MAVKEAKSNEMNVRVKDNAQFYSNDLAINVSPTEFVLDFKCMSQVQDIMQHSAVVVTHQPVVISPIHAKGLVDILSKAIIDYEKKFGKIEKPKAVKKAEKLVEKTKKQKKGKVVTKPENYFG